MPSVWHGSFPLSGLPEAITLCAKLIDKPFIYVSPEDMDAIPDWADEAVAQLAEWWQEASLIFDAISALARSVDQDNDERLAQIVSLLLTAHQVITQPA